MHRLNWMQKMADEMDLVGETLPGMPVVEIAGEKRVLIENHEGVSAYSCEKICVKVRYGLVCVCGSELNLINMTRERLIISGCIHSIQLHRRCC